MPESGMVRLLEMQFNGVKYAPTGRAIELAPDCPLFVQWGEAGKQAVKEGNAAISGDLFKELLLIVKEMEDGGEATNV